MGEQTVIAALSVFFGVVVFLILLVIVLASIGQSLGLRQAYVDLLLKLFEFCKYKVQVTSPAEVTEGHDSDGEEEVEESKEDITEKREDASTANGGRSFTYFPVSVTGFPSEIPFEKLTDVRVIDKDFSLTANRGLHKPEWEPFNFKKKFDLSDIMYFSKCGMEAIIDDDVTKRFSAEELASWNLLTRTQKAHQFMSIRLTVMWGLGCFIRYMILLPFRITIAIIGIFVLMGSSAFLGLLEDSTLKQRLNHLTTLISFRILCRACSGVIRFHNRENKAISGICVANHTSPFDVVMLSCDNCYAMIGQTHGGFLGALQRSMSRAAAHIWFERTEAKDRSLVARRLLEHVQDPTKMPILIFPEGTCINNTSVMMFKKGSFEIDTTIYPMAIKYDPRFADAFWNSSRHTWTQHLLRIMSSWALVCDVWYLPPMNRREGETGVDFANRVKSEIARQGGLVDLDWDGGLKRSSVKESMKEIPKEQYSKILKVE